MLSLAVLLAVVSAILAIDALWAHRLDVAVASGIVATFAACAALVGTLPVALGIVAAWLLASLGIGTVVLLAGIARQQDGGAGLDLRLRAGPRLRAGTGRSGAGTSRGPTVS